MAKKRLAPQQPSGTGPAKTSESISKSEAIRRALDEGHPMAKDGVVFIRKTFGLEVSPAVYSALKSKIEAKKKHKAPAARKRAKDTPESTPPAAKEKAPAKANVLEDVKKVKELVERHGAGAVLEMVELFEK